MITVGIMHNTTLSVASSFLWIVYTGC